MTALFEPHALIDSGAGRLTLGREAIRALFAEITATGRKFESGTAFGRAASVLKERRETLDKAAQALLAKETLTGEELRMLIGAERSDAAKSVPAVATSPLSS